MLSNPRAPRQRSAPARSATTEGTSEAAAAGGLQAVRRKRHDPPRQPRRIPRQGARTSTAGRKARCWPRASMVSLHIPLGERLFRTRKFDLRGMKSILDVGSGAGPARPAPAQVRRPRTRRSPAPICRSRCSAGPATGSRAACRRTSPPTCRRCRSPTNRSTASPAATCSSTCPIRRWGWPNSRA